MTSEGNSYQLLYFSPRPEDLEQVCVAVAIKVEGRYLIEYDEKLAKMKCIARDRDVIFVRDALETIRHAVNGDFAKVTSEFQPQFHVSEPRRLLVPWSEDVRRQLKKRFLLRGRQISTHLEHEHQKQFESKLSTLIDKIAPGSQSNFVSEVKPELLFPDTVAHSFRNPKAISRAIIGGTRAVLIDGVDTTVGDSTEVIQRANKIAFTFWQYGKALHNDSLPTKFHREIIRVGVVFDGEPKARVLREYSLHQFTKDADLAIEAEAEGGFDRVRAEIKKTLQDIRI